MKKEEAIKVLKVHREHCRTVGDKIYADALDYAIRYLSKSNNSSFIARLIELKK